MLPYGPELRGNDEVADWTIVGVMITLPCLERWHEQVLQRTP
jgi:hypothetical protein